jgi:hypothetical protein
MRFTTTVFTGLVFLPAALFAAADKPDPTDATAAVPPARYDSAFDGYVAFQDREPGAWRERNEEMGRVGGHAGHLKGPANTLPPSVPPRTSTEPTTPKGAMDHGAHQKSMERAP